MHKSAKWQWEYSDSKYRNEMLLNIGIRQRTLTLRHFDQLPIEVKVDLNYSIDLSSAPHGVPHHSHLLRGVAA